LPETKAKIAHNGRISLYATQGIGQKQFSLNAPASRLKKSCREVKSNFLSFKAGLFPETKAKVAHNGRISLYATQGIGQKQFFLNAPASRLKKSCRGLRSNFLSFWREDWLVPRREARARQK